MSETIAQAVGYALAGMLAGFAFSLPFRRQTTRRKGR